jgi:hypothetical protein
MRTTLAFALLLAVSVLPQATGQGSTSPGTTAPPGATSSTTTPDLSVPKDTGTQWTVGFSVFAAEDVSAENTYLRYSLPLLLQDAVSGLSTHAVSDEEREGIRRDAIEREIAASQRSITSIRKERDALLFADAAAAAKSNAALVDARIAAAVGRRDFLQSLDPGAVDVAAEKPVAFKQGTEEGKLLDAPVVPEPVYCDRQGLDLLVGGSLEEMQGYLLVNVWAFDAALGRRVFSSRNVAMRDELYASISALGRELASTILGRAWSLVAFAPDPPEAALYVDGSLVALGSSPALYLVPGQHEIRISAPGYRDIVRTVSLDPSAESRIDDGLDKEIQGSITVTTDPVGADLYVDSIWQGTTPLLLDIPAERSRAVASLEGYYPSSFLVYPDSASLLTVPLRTDVGSRDAVEKKKRDDFYASLGWFAASIPLPLFSYSLVTDLSTRSAEYAAAGDDQAATNALTASKVFSAAYWGGIAVAAGVFAWMVTRIIDYLTAAGNVGG